MAVRGTLVCALMSPTPYRLAEGYGSALWYPSVCTHEPHPYRLAEGYGSALWFVLVTEWTLVNVDQLDTALSTYDPHKVSSDSL